MGPPLDMSDQIDAKLSEEGGNIISIIRRRDR